MKFGEWKHRLLDRYEIRDNLLAKILLLKGLTDHATGGHFRQCHPGCLGYKWHST